jgi:hypothetical protein
MAHTGWGVMKVHTKYAKIGTTPDQLPNFFLKFVVQRRYLQGQQRQVNRKECSLSLFLTAWKRRCGRGGTKRSGLRR